MPESNENLSDLDGHSNINKNVKRLFVTENRKKVSRGSWCEPVSVKGALFNLLSIKYFQKLKRLKNNSLVHLAFVISSPYYWFVSSGVCSCVVCWD